MLYGHLTITVYDVKSGKKKRLFRIAKKNQITNGGREVVVALLAQDAGGTILQANPEYNQIWSLAVGTNSTPPSIGDISLYSEVLPPGGRMVLTIPAEREFVIVPPSIFEVHIHKELPTHTLTGTMLAEAGLYTRGDNDLPSASGNQVLYARQIHPVFEKGEFMAVEYDWRLGMLAQA
jgi:hypothetical protein